jgi:uncharacterized repeat protein (TIGR03803 family)
MDAAGNLFGTATLGGAFKNGGIFELSTSGKYSILHSFNATTDGYGSWGLVRDAAGTLYGTNTYGGPNGAGSVFSLDTSGNFRVIHAFTGGSDGDLPDAGLMIDTHGNLYGTTGGGGGSAGVIFEMDKSTGAETVLYSFDGVVGNGPEGPLVLDEQGNLYGTTVGGGVYNSGTVFRLDPAGNLTVLHNFGYFPDGITPYAGLARDSSGSLYGTTFYGGTGTCGQEYYGCGVVFEITP